MNSNTLRVSQYIKEARKKKKSNDGNLANNYPPYGKVTRGDVVAGRLGKDQMGGKRKVSEALIGKQYKIDVNKNERIDSEDLKILRSNKKRKSVKEGYSNWREELIEVSDHITTRQQNTERVEEKKVKNKININPVEKTGDRLSVRESVGKLGGTLLELKEYHQECILEELNSLELLAVTDELLEEVVYDFFIEALEEGYELSEIEKVILESIENSFQLLTEEDNPRKRGVLGRLKGAVKRAAKGIARSAGYLAGLGARAVVRGAQEVGKGAVRGYKGAKDDDEEEAPSRTRVTQSSSERRSEPSRTRVTQSASEPRVRQTARDGVRKGLRKTLSNWARYAGHKLDPEHGKPHQAQSKTGVRTARTYRGVGGGKKVEVAGTQKKEPKVQRVSVRDVTPSGSSTSTRQTSRRVEPDPWEGSYTSSRRTAASPSRTSSSTEQQARSKKFKSKTSDPTGAKAAYKKTASGVRLSQRLADLRRQRAASSTSKPPTEKTTTVSTSSVTSRSPRRSRGKGTPRSTPTTVTSSSTPKSSRKKGKKGSTVEIDNPELNKPGSDLDKLLKSMKSESYQLTEKSESEQQQKLFGLALSVKRGQTPRSEASSAVLKIVDTMTEKQIRDFAKTKHEGLPKKVTKEEAIREELTIRMLAKIIEQSDSMPNTTQSTTQQNSKKSSIINSKKRLLQQQLNSLNKGVDIDV